MTNITIAILGINYTFEFQILIFKLIGSDIYQIEDCF